MSIQNIIFATDSYKWGHWKQYPKETRGVFSYMESRTGAQFPKTVFFGLQKILEDLEGVVVTQDDIEEAAFVARAHFGQDDLFNRKGWEHIVNNLGGKLPVRIMAVDEGTPVPAGNVMMTVENTDPDSFWLTNALESLLLHVWYPSTVASLSYDTKQMLKRKLAESGASEDGLGFMLHDFGYRGATTHDAAAIGGAGHLVNFMGTDTLPALKLAHDTYDADYATLGFSVAATEHSVMTARGKLGEREVVKQLFEEHPTGILSVVADSYNIYEFVDNVCTIWKDEILRRDGKFVVRPDSTTKDHPQPESLMLDLVDRLWVAYGGTTNDKGFKVLDPKIGILWGDGIGPDGIEKILDCLIAAGYSAENFVFGMGGGLLQKVNRDTQRSAFKSSAQLRNGVWIPIQKEPLDATKKSKPGRLKLIKGQGGWGTVDEANKMYKDVPNELKLVFENGAIKRRTTFDEVRARAI